MTVGALAFGDGVEDALAEVAAIAAEFPPIDVPGTRMFDRARARLGGRAPDLHEVRNVTISRRFGGLGLRVYRPAPGPLPVALFIHGGAFVSGDLEATTPWPGCWLMPRGVWSSAFITGGGLSTRAPPRRMTAQRPRSGWSSTRPTSGSTRGPSPLSATARAGRLLPSPLVALGTRAALSSAGRSCCIP